MDIQTARMTPVVKHIRPAVKVNEELPPVVDVADGGHTDQGGVLSVLRLQFGPNLKVFGITDWYYGRGLILLRERRREGGVGGKRGGGGS